MIVTSDTCTSIECANEMKHMTYCIIYVTNGHKQLQNCRFFFLITVNEMSVFTSTVTAIFYRRNRIVTPLFIEIGITVALTLVKLLHT